MIGKSTLVLVSALLAVDFPAKAQSDGEFSACVERSEGVSTEMLACGKAQIDKWDRRLNAAYDALLHKTTGAERTALQKAQRAWLHHHLQETLRLASDPDGGSGAFMVSQSFELDDLMKRTLLLEMRGGEKP